VHVILDQSSAQNSCLWAAFSPKSHTNGISYLRAARKKGFLGSPAPIETNDSAAPPNTGTGLISRRPNKIE
jgi:hypothetical protein